MESHKAILQMREGARYRKCDLHVHTPGSRDIHDDDKNATPADVVAAIAAAGVEVVAVTDHNSSSWCERVAEAARDHNVTVLPGVELSTPEGHLLGIFDPGTNVQVIDDLIVECGIDTANMGALDAVTSMPMDEVARRVDRRGGLAIAAHIDSPRGFLACAPVGARRSEIANCPEIVAVETHDDDLADQCMVNGLGEGSRRFSAVDSSDSWEPESDAHRVRGIGSHYCFLKMDDISTRGIRQALLDPKVRLSREATAPNEPEIVIEGVAVNDGFLKGQVIRLSPSITCLIGGTGAGKSLTLELVRFALDQQVSPAVLPSIRADVDRLLPATLTDSSKVSLLLRKGDSRYLVERAWLERGEAEPAVYRVMEDGALEPISPAPDLPSFFPIKAFSQGEIIEFAREPLARLSLIDDLIDLGAEKASIAKTKSALRENASTLIEARRMRDDAQDRLSNLTTVHEEIRSLERFFNDERVVGRKVWEQERSLLSDAREALTSLSANTDSTLAAIDARLTQVSIEEPANRDLLDRLDQLEGRVQAAVDRTRSEALRHLSQFDADLTKIETEWADRFKEADKAYRQVLIELDRDGQARASLVSRLDELQEQERQLEALRRKLDESIQGAVTTAEATRESLLNTLQEARKSITTKRQAKARELTARLDAKVRIAVRKDRDGRKFLEALKGIRVGSHVQDSQLDVMATELHPIRLAKSFEADDSASPAAVSGLDRRLFERLFDNIREKGLVGELYDLQLVDLDDVVEVQFAVETDTYRDLASLAHGQKCTVVLMIALAEGSSPLLVDQPEDALHAPWIEEYIVSRLRGDRGTRQCLFATRSASVMVSSDAEQIVAMDADADKGWVVDYGNIDRFDTRTLVLFHVEGGEEAFARRRAKYDL